MKRWLPVMFLFSAVAAAITVFGALTVEEVTIPDWAVLVAWLYSSLLAAWGAADLVARYFVE